MKKKLISLLLIILGIILILVAVFLIINGNHHDEKNEKNIEERFQIKGGTLPLCSKDHIDESDYDSDNNIIFSNENYQTDKDGNRQNTSSLIKEKHDIDELTITNVNISSKRCTEKVATLNAEIINNGDVDIIDKMLTFNFINNSGSVSSVSLFINIEAKQEINLDSDFVTRIIDAKDYTLTISDMPELDG